ncbi:hypothetical protein [Oceanibacterium hippocampi]|uniref:Uncharacterized protein n=1 Tax=Oceanibacterium hippocampi TaxID=745714 RepID=A0A1Y5TE97_9PROT|nr:hypothetical protein [Oceanibacterium hippocampi]SLN59971.1 hypothetical protein OCH7691_02643 [Oceanibacterium hippocampi]
MIFIKSALYGYAGAALAGTAIAVFGLMFGFAEKAIIGAAAPAGIAAGLFGFGLPWARQALASARRDPT